MSDESKDPVAEVLKALAAPFPDSDVSFRPTSVKGNRALALPYLNARAVQDRLDDVVGPANWQDEYTVVGPCSVACKLSIRLAGEWISKMDFGATSDQPDPGDKMKAAASDAMKRAAVKWGVGRFLYALPKIWADYDPGTKQFRGDIKLPQVVGRVHQPALVGKVEEALVRAPTVQLLDTYRANYRQRSSELARPDFLYLEGLYLQCREALERKAKSA